MRKSAIEITGICKSFADRCVLEQITFNADSGKGYCLCGPNAAGKTTLLRIIAGLLKPNAGTLQVYGFDFSHDADKIKPMLGAIFHRSMIYPQLTVEENLQFFAKLYGMKNGLQRLDELLEQTGLSPYRFDIAGILSRGMQQRLSIARAIVHKPKVLLADEPFSGLDTEANEHLIRILFDFKNSGGTIIMTTHNVELSLRCCDHVMVLDNHRLILNETTARIDVAEFRNDYLSYARAPR